MRGLLLVLSLNGSSATRPDDGWFSTDKVKHFLTSAFVQSLAYGSLRGVGASHGTALLGATITTAAVGVGKEVYDARSGGDPSVRDLAWDAAGAGAVSLLLSHTAR
jgi:putative lipoprotein